MAELTKTDNRQPMGKIKPTDKMVMMLSLFDGTKPAMSKQHYEKFNLYINFQTKSSHLTDPVREAIDLFKHTLDKTALVWFQMNRPFTGQGGNRQLCYMGIYGITPYYGSPTYHYLCMGMGMGVSPQIW